MVSFIELAIGVVPVMLVAAALKTVDSFANWSFAQVLLLLVIPAAVVHWAVLCRYVKLRAEPMNSDGALSSDPSLGLLASIIRRDGVVDGGILDTSLGLVATMPASVWAANSAQQSTGQVMCPKA